MNQRIIYTNEAGGVSVVIPAQESGLTVEEIAARVVPEGVAFEIVDVSSIPTERTFRNAWERSGKAIAHNITKAKGLAHETRRQRRADEFAPLDVEATIPAKAAKEVHDIAVAGIGVLHPHRNRMGGIEHPAFKGAVIGTGTEDRRRH